MHTATTLIDSTENCSINNNSSIEEEDIENDENITSKEDTKNSSSSIWNIINNFSRTLFPIKSNSSDKKKSDKDEKEIDEENINNVKCNENLKFIDSPLPKELETEEEKFFNQNYPSSTLHNDCHQLSLHHNKRHNKLLRSSSDSMNSYDSDSSDDSISDINSPLNMKYYSRAPLNPIINNHNATNTTNLLPPLDTNKNGIQPIPISRFHNNNEFQHHHSQMTETSFIPSSSLLAMQFDHTLTLSPSKEDLYDNGRELYNDPPKLVIPTPYNEIENQPQPVDGLLNTIREGENNHYEYYGKNKNDSQFWDTDEEGNRINNYSTISKELYDKLYSDDKDSGLKEENGSINNSRPSSIKEKKVINNDLVDPQNNNNNSNNNNIEVITNGVPIVTIHANTTSRKIIENEIIKEVIDGNLTDLSEDLVNNKKLSTSPFSIHSVHSTHSHRSNNSNGNNSLSGSVVHSPFLFSSSPDTIVSSPSLSSKKSTNSISLQSHKRKNSENSGIDLDHHLPIHYEKKSSIESTHSSITHLRKNSKLCDSCKNDLRCISSGVNSPSICSCRNDIRHISPKLGSTIVKSSPKLSATINRKVKSATTDGVFHSKVMDTTSSSTIDDHNHKHNIFNKKKNIFNAVNQQSIDDIKFSKNTNVFNALASPITTIPLDKVREVKEVVSKKIPIEIKDDNRVITHQITNPTAAIKTIKVLSKSQTVPPKEEHLEDTFFHSKKSIINDDNININNNNDNNNNNNNLNNAFPITNKLSSSPDNNINPILINDVNNSLSMTSSPKNGSIFNTIENINNSNININTNNSNIENENENDNDNKNENLNKNENVNNNDNDITTNKDTLKNTSTISSIMTSSIAIEKPSNHEQIVKPVIDTNFLMNSNSKSIIPDKKSKIGDEVLSDPTNLLINDTSSDILPPPFPKPTPALSLSTKEETHHHRSRSSSPKKPHTINCPINISTTTDNKVSSHYLNQNEKFIGIFNYIELPPTNKHKKSKKRSKEDVHVNKDQIPSSSTSSSTSSSASSSPNPKEILNSTNIKKSSVTFELGHPDDMISNNIDMEDENENENEIITINENNVINNNNNNNINNKIETKIETETEIKNENDDDNDNDKVCPKPLNKEEISKQIDKEFKKIQAQLIKDELSTSIDDITHDGVDSEISILSPYSPNNINILDQDLDINIGNAIPIQAAITTQCSQSPFSISEGKHKTTRARARSRAHSLNHLRNRSFTGKLGLGSFGLGLANLTNLTENGEITITEDNPYLYNLETDASLDGLSTVSSNLSINLK